MHVPPMPQQPPGSLPGPPSDPLRRPARSRTRRLVAAGALLSAAALGTVFSVQAVAASDDGSAPPGFERPDPVSEGTPSEKSEKERFTYEAGPGDGEQGDGPRFALVMLVKGDVDKAEKGAADFSECMRANGLGSFPDVKVSDAGDGRVRLEVSGSGEALDPGSEAYEKAYEACAPVMEKAGVPLPEEPAGPPAPPKPGGSGTDEGPSLDDLPNDTGEQGTTEST